jgi:hypothetical protein
MGSRPRLVHSVLQTGQADVMRDWYCIVLGVTSSLYHRDPDGNFVELQVDNFVTPEEATSYMEGPMLILTGAS